MRLYAIGDVHGCLAELDEILEKIHRDIDGDDAPAKVIFLGDYVDRGPDSKGVLDRVMSLESTDKIEYVFLMGNHEDMMLNNHMGFVMNGGWDTLKSFGLTDPRDIPQKYVDFVRNLRYYYKYDRYVFVHAGLIPHKAVEDHDPQDLMWNRDWVKYDGEFHDGYFVIHGHTPEFQIRANENQINLDTGCVFGGELSSLRIDLRDPSRIEVVQVKSKKETK